MTPWAAATTTRSPGSGSARRARSARRSRRTPGAAPTTAGAAHRPARGPARHGGGNGRPIPQAPLAPPGNAGAGGVAGASGGAATGVWCALLAGTLVFLAQSFRRHRFRLVAPAPGGVVFLLQRPG